MKLLVWCAVITAVVSCIPKNLEVQKPIRVEEGERQKPDYQVYASKSVEGDPLNVKEYTLKNGLKVFLSVNKEKPRIQTQISVRAGGKNDPANATGLAHYLEHLLFKGSTRLGTIDYEKEKVELDKIRALYEVYRQANDSVQRDSIYHRIDSVSTVASKYACMSEFDQAHAVMGVKGTNAHTTHDYTAYVSNIPSNQLENWLTLEAERFSNPVIIVYFRNKND